MKLLTATLLTILTVLASSNPVMASGLTTSTFSDPVVAKPVCTETFLFWTWRTPCNATTSSPDWDRSRNTLLVVGVQDSDEHTTTERSEPVKGNNGLGNGDQKSPGNSLNNNSAENQAGNPGHKSGKNQNSN